LGLNLASRGDLGNDFIDSYEGNAKWPAAQPQNSYHFGII
jgi:hypothetical protein